jgi:hypothetical protein
MLTYSLDSIELKLESIVGALRRSEIEESFYSKLRARLEITNRCTEKRYTIKCTS